MVCPIMSSSMTMEHVVSKSNHGTMFPSVINYIRWGFALTQVCLVWMLSSQLCCWLQRVQAGALNGTAFGTALRHVVPWKVSRTVRCTSCDITLNSEQQAKQHFSGKAHQRRLHKLQQQQLKELQLPETETETPTTGSRDEEPKQDADVERQSSGVDDVMSDQLDTDVATQSNGGEYTG